MSCPFGVPSICYVPVMSLPTLFVLQTGTPGDCVLTGLCGVVAEPESAIPSGVMYLAAGLVLVGLYGWRRLRQRDFAPVDQTVECNRER